MIDLEALKREAASGAGDRAVVSRAWLRQAAAEIEAGRAAHAQLGQVFGRQGKAL